MLERIEEDIEEGNGDEGEQGEGGEDEQDPGDKADSGSAMPLDTGDEEAQPEPEPPKEEDSQHSFGMEVEAPPPAPAAAPRVSTEAFGDNVGIEELLDFRRLRGSWPTNARPRTPGAGGL